MGYKLREHKAVHHAIMQRVTGDHSPLMLQCGNWNITILTSNLKIGGFERKTSVTNKELVENPSIALGGLITFWPSN